MTGAELTTDGQQPADVRGSAVLRALLGGGRFAEAATYYLALDDAEPAQHAQLLLAAGRTTDAHAVLQGLAQVSDEDGQWVAFLRRIDVILQGDAGHFADLITASTAFAGIPFVPLLMLRAACAADQPEAAAHYARLVLQMVPGSTDANRVYAVDLIRRGSYIDAVRSLDKAEQLRCRDEPSTLQGALATINSSEAFVLTLIGRFAHREKDATQARTDSERQARQRWREAYQPYAHRLRRRRLIWAVPVAAGVGTSIAVGNVLPSVLVVLAVIGWTRSRSLPGLDLRTSQMVRTLSDPLQIIKVRRYRPVDVLTFVLTCVVAGGLASRIPHQPSWLGAVEAVVAIVLAVVATRGRRRWVRHERERLLPQPLDPSHCRCLDVHTLYGRLSRRYVEEHLFPIGAAPGAPLGWGVLQCLGTHTRFLDLRHAELTLRLPDEP